MPKWAGAQHQVHAYNLPVEQKVKKTCFSLPFHAVLQYDPTGGDLQIVQYEKNQILGGGFMAAPGERIENVQVSPNGRYYVVFQFRGQKRNLSFFSFSTLKWSRINLP